MLCYQCIDGQQPPFLFGITGSGKTEVCLESSRSLGPRCSSICWYPLRFLWPLQGGGSLLVSARESSYSSFRPVRDQPFRAQVERGDNQVVAFGAQSAIFAPLKNLGVMIDEEHDDYKQTT